MTTLHEGIFDSVAATRKIKPSDANLHVFQNSQDDDRGARWWGTDGGTKEVARLLDEGWDAGVKRLNEALATVEVPPVMSLRRRRIRADEGDEINMQDVYAGDLDLAWRRIGKRPKLGPRHVTIVCDIAANADVRAETLFWRGAATLKLADALSAAGYSVRIIAADNSTNIENSGDAIDSYLQVTVKEFDQPLALTSLASVICLAGYFRSVGFAWVCACARRVSSGFGHHSTREITKRFAGKDCIIVSSRIATAETASQWVKDAVARIESGSTAFAVA